MAADISITLNFPRTELLKSGWHKSRLASAMKPGQFVTNPAIGGLKIVPGSLPAELWREPNKGVIMMKPCTLLPEFWEDEGYADLILDASKWNYHDDSDYGGATGSGILSIWAGTRPGVMVTRRASSASALIELLVSLALLTILDSMKSDMVWVMQTKDPLKANEGISFWVHPPGTFTDRATDYMLIAFGGKYVLHLKMNGSASLWSNAGTAAAPEWVERVTFKYSGGGVDHNKPFQVTIIPWGFGYITFLFSQSSEPEKHIQSDIKSPKTNTYLYDIRKHEDAPLFDTTINQWVKTKAAPVSVALRRYLHQYGFAWSRVRYVPSMELAIVAEQLPDVIENDPVITPRGFASNFVEPNGGGSLTVAHVNHKNLTWNNATDKQLVLKYTFGSSSDNVYTPELWSTDIDIDEVTHTPDWTPLDVSDRWTYARFQMTVDPQVSIGEFKLELGKDGDDFFNGMFKVGGPVRMEMGGEAVFDGYVTRKMPVLEGPSAILAAQFEARDLWIRLDEKQVPDFKFLDGLDILDVIVALIKAAGFTDADIEIDDPTGYIGNLEFAGFEDPNDQKAINQDGTVGDVLREILKQYGVRPIRVRVVGGKWKIYLAPEYNEASPPTKIFYLVSDGTDIEGMSDADRFAASKYKVLSNPEIDVQEPEFNALIGRASNQTADGAEGLQSSISGYVCDQESMTDPESFWFIGREKLKIVGPPEITLAQTQGELDKITRVFWNRNHRKRPVVELNAEFRPEMDADDFVWLVGVGPAVGETVDEVTTYSQPLVSYGAWRIESINVEAYLDSETRDLKWATTGDYVMSFVGKAENEDFPMFTDDENLPL